MPFIYHGGIPEGPEDEESYTAKYWITAVLLVALAYLLALNVARYLGWEPNALETYLLKFFLCAVFGRLSRYMPK